MNTFETYSRKKLLAKISLAFLFDCLYFTIIVVILRGRVQRHAHYHKLP